MTNIQIHRDKLFYITDIAISGVQKVSTYTLNMIVDTGAATTMLPLYICRLILKSGGVIYEAPNKRQMLLTGVGNSKGTLATLYFMNNVTIGGLLFPRFYFYVPASEGNPALLGMDIISNCCLHLEGSDGNLTKCDLEKYLEYYDNLSGYDSVIFPQLAVFTE